MDDTEKPGDVSDFSWEPIQDAKITGIIVFEDGQPRDAKGRFRKRQVERIDLKEQRDG